MIRVIVTGSRDFDDEPLIWHELDALLHRHGEVMLVHGAHRSGADDIADRWYRQRRSEGRAVHVRRYPANWRRHGNGAGPIRNQAMVDAGGDLVLAFYVTPAPGVDPLTVNKGTHGCVTFAREALIPVWVFGPETPATPTYEQETLL